MSLTEYASWFGVEAAGLHAAVWLADQGDTTELRRYGVICTVGRPPAESIARQRRY